jgi:hypothetical protein
VKEKIYKIQIYELIRKEPGGEKKCVEKEKEVKREMRNNNYYYYYYKCSYLP